MAKRKQRRGTAKGVTLGAIAVIICALLAWLIGWGVTGDMNPIQWGKPAPVETSVHATVCNAEELHNHALELNSDGGGIESRIVGGWTVIYGPDQCPDCSSAALDFSAGSDYKAATCSIEGEGLIKTCTSCGWSGGPYKIRIDPDMHTDLRLTSETPATCVTAGSKTYTCQNCGGTRTDTVRATGVHNYSWVITTKPVNGNAGVESYKCATCTSVTDTRNVFALPANPEKEGYHFVGWYKDEALTIAYDSDYIYSDTALYAKFEINEYTVTFDTCGGNEIDSVTVEWNTSITPAIPTKTGYNFLGWYMSDGDKYEGQNITGNTVLTARWQIKTFTVTFYVNGQVYTTVTVEYGSVLSKVADDAGVYSRNIVSFLNLNSDTPTEYASEMVVTDDMRVTANEPTVWQKVFSKSNLPFFIAVGCVVVLLGIIGGVVSGKKRRGKS